MGWRRCRERRRTETALGGARRPPRRRGRQLVVLRPGLDEVRRKARLGARIGPAPLDGVGPDELPLADLSRRVREESITEVILATPPSVDGEATALLLARELGAQGVRISRIASGVPHGGDLEFADQVTLGRAIDGRRSMG